MNQNEERLVEECLQIMDESDKYHDNCQFNLLVDKCDKCGEIFYPGLTFFSVCPNCIAKNKSCSMKRSHYLRRLREIFLDI